jgi:hypothetical protein
MRIVLGVLWVLLASAAFALVITERRVDCSKELVGRLHETNQEGVFRTALYVTCTTYDDNGNIVRAQREYDVTNRLSPQQLSALTNLLNQVPTLVAQNEAIPTPTPAP